MFEVSLLAEILNKGLLIIISLILLKVVSVFGTDGQSLRLKDLLGEGHLITPPFAVGVVLVRHPGRSARVGVIVNISAIVIELIVIRPVGKTPPVAKRAIVAQIEVAARVYGVGSGDVEYCSEGSGRNPLIPRSKHSLQCEVAPGSIGKKLVKLVTVCVHRNAVVSGGIVEFLEEKLVLPMGIIEGAGKKHFQTIIKLICRS